MNAGVVVRRLGAGDVAPLRQLNRMFGEAFDDADTYLSAAPSNEYRKRLLAKRDIVVLVATVDEAVVGGLVAYELMKIEQARSELYIYDLAVAAAYRRQGIATDLIRRLTGIARDLGAWVIYVQADIAVPSS